MSNVFNRKHRLVGQQNEGFDNPYSRGRSNDKDAEINSHTRFSLKMASTRNTRAFPMDTHLLANGLSCYTYRLDGVVLHQDSAKNGDYEKMLNEVYDDFVSYCKAKIKGQVPDAKIISDDDVQFILVDDVAVAMLYTQALITGLELDLDIDPFNERIAALLPPTPIYINLWSEEESPRGDMELGNKHVDIAGANMWAKDSFYPNLSGTIDDKVNEFLTSPNNMWLFYGLPGTGKSTLARQICKTVASDHDVWKRRVHVINSSFIIKTPNFAAKLNMFGDNDVVIMEDADILLGKRKDGNDFMSALLNKLDGIVRSGLKIIFSCNLTTLKDVDEALLRPGRLYEATYFGKLDEAQTKAIAAEVPAVKRTGDGLVLAELFEKPAQTVGVGFL